MPTFLIPSKKGTKMKKQRIWKTNSLSKMNKEEERIRRIRQAGIEQIKEIELVIEWLMEWAHPYSKWATDWMIHLLTLKVETLIQQHNAPIS